MKQSQNGVPFLKRAAVLCGAAAVVLLSSIAVQAAGTGTKGIDVSRYNGKVDWNAVKKQKMTFAMIKSGDGKDVGNPLDQDPQFEANYAGAGRAGLKRGVYHVCYTTTVAGARAEARYCLQILNGRKLEYPVAYDMEMPATFAKGKKQVTAIARAFCEEIRKAGYQPMIYASASYLSQYYDWKSLKGVKIWAAHYGVKKPAIKKRWQIWQYSGTGKIVGASNEAGDTDLNLSRMEAPKKITLNRKKVTLKKGETFQIRYQLNRGAYTRSVTYCSAKKRIASVNAKGLVTAKKRGRTKITVQTRNGKSAILRVRVK